MKKTHEEYVKEVELINPNIEVVDKYINSKTAIFHKCKIHQLEWKIKPEKILSGCTCLKCAIERRTKTNEEYIEEVRKINPNIKVIDKYINSKTKILHMCLKDSFTWYAVPDSILHGSGCPKCGGTKKITQEEYIKRVYQINHNIEVIENYKSYNEKILHRCKIDGLEFKITPHHVICGIGCPKCAGVERKTQEKYIQEVKDKNKNIEVIEEYINAVTPILHLCKIHNYKWKARPNNILNGCGCPICNESKGEKTIREWLIENNKKYESQYKFKNCIDKGKLPYDFYLKEYNMCIEYQGEQHYFPVDFAGKGEQWSKNSFLEIKRRDGIKKDYCKNNNIILLCIPYWEDTCSILNNTFKLIC